MITIRRLATSEYVYYICHSKKKKLLLTNFDLRFSTYQHIIGIRHIQHIALEF